MLSLSSGRWQIRSNVLTCYSEYFLLCDITVCNVTYYPVYHLNLDITVLFSNFLHIILRESNISKDLSPDLCCYGVLGSLHVGLAVNISGLLYMVCCRCQPLHCFFPSLLGLISKCTDKVSLILSSNSFCSGHVHYVQWIHLMYPFNLNVFSIIRLLYCFISAWQDSTLQDQQPVGQLEVQERVWKQSKQDTERERCRWSGGGGRKGG